MVKIWLSVKNNWGIWTLAFGFSIWALAFIYHSTYNASDGRLYFTLFDDAFISMRYAWNLAHGNGLVWNRGEYIEGYTNLLMTLLMALAAFMVDEKRYAVFVVQFIGIFFSLGAAFFSLQIFKTFKTNLQTGPLLFAAVLLYYPLNYWSLLGMETGLLACLLGAGVFCSLRYAETLRLKYLIWMTLCFGLAYLTRNDSILFAALSFLYLTQTLKKNARAFFAAGLTLSLFPLGQSLFRLYYYGQILPNTYTLKLVGMALDERLHNGWGFIQPFLRESSWVLIVAALGLFLKPAKQKFYLFVFFLISIFYQIYVGGDPWTYWRIIAPAMPFIWLLFILAGNELLNLIPKRLPTAVNYLALISLTLFGLYQTDARFFKQMTLQELPFDVDAAYNHIEIAIALNAVAADQATIGVFWAGTLPYYTDFPAIDFLGKSDAYIAHLAPDTSGAIAWDGMDSVPGHNKYDLAYSIQTLLPTYVDDLKWGKQDLTAWGETHYVHIKYKKVWLYLLKDSPNVKWAEVEIK
ncbi:MAG: hypothetical protein IT311_12770 [Anaerolineales bacterium]|nr:hypothetical protein [Anaerolineales bacterium]